MRFFVWATLILHLIILGETNAKYYKDPRNNPHLPSICGTINKSVKKRQMHMFEGLNDRQSGMIGGYPDSIVAYDPSSSASSDPETTHLAPMMVLLKYRTSSSTETVPMCGGSLISKRYVLTAAHCVAEDKLSTKVLTGVILGELNRETDIDCEPYGNSGFVCADKAIFIGVEETIIHELFDSESHYLSNDIALLRLIADVTFNDFITPICLPWNRYVESRLTVAGWGKTDSREQSDILMKLTVPSVEMETCQAIYNENPMPFELGHGQLCAGGEWGKDACKGDSGGPLMSHTLTFHGTQRAWTVIGIVSFNKGDCGEYGVPSVYTKVYDYLDWIVEKIEA